MLGIATVGRYPEGSGPMHTTVLVLQMVDQTVGVILAIATLRAMRKKGGAD
jgi:hypothetical protein